MRIIYLFLITTVLLQCRSDSGERLFDLNFPNNRFVIPAGLNTIQSHFFTLDPVPNNLENLLISNAINDSEISRVEPFAATLTSLNGFELDFIEEISVRICDPDDLSNCEREVFFLDNIRFNTGTVIELLPTLIDAKDFFIDSDRIVLRVVLLRLRDIPFTNYDCRFDFSFDVRK